MKPLILVDAGYLLMACRKLVEPATVVRGALSIDGCAAVGVVRKEAASAIGSSCASLPLRWYDAVSDGEPYPHADVADAAGASLVLGRISSGRQKGVDTALSIDLVEAALERNFDRIVLVSGDGDFVPAVEKAAEKGCRTDLLVVPCLGSNGSVSPQLSESCAAVHRFSFAGACRVLGRPAVSSVKSEIDTAFKAAITDIISSLAYKGLLDRVARQIGENPSVPLPHDIDGWLLRSASHPLGRDLNLAERSVLRRMFRLELAVSVKS